MNVWQQTWQTDLKDFGQKDTWKGLGNQFVAEHPKVGGAALTSYGHGKAMASTKAGSAFLRGTTEIAGFSWDRGDYRGWMGWRGANVGGSSGYLGKAYDRNLKHLNKTKSSFARSKAFGGAMSKATQKYGGASLAGGLAKGAVFPGIQMFFMYNAYKNGGIAGVAEEAAFWGATEMAMTVIGGANVAALAVGGAAAYGAYALGEAAQEHHKQLGKMELGTPVLDPYGTGATLRQRSLNALNNSHYNGRMALGNEGMLMHS